MPRHILILPAACMVLACLPHASELHAQRHSTALSEAEEEEVRDAAADPAHRVTVYQGIIESRVKRIQSVLANTRAQG